MASTLQAIKGGGGSIKVGTTGTINALMSRELESMKIAADTCHTGASTPKKINPRTSTDEASSSSVINRKNLGISRKPKYYHSKSHQVPILNPGNISRDGTPIWEKPEKRGGAYIVEVVDVKCTNAERTWTKPITNRLKKLGFLKLSENIA